MNKKTEKNKKRDYSKKFHDDINKLLRNAGFRISKVNYGKSEPDTVCSVDGNKILIQCKSTKKDDCPYANIQHSVNEYTTKVRRQKAKVAILAFEKHRIPDKYLGDKLLKSNNVVIWNDRIIDYYKKSVDSLGKYARFPLMGDLGISEEPRKPFSVPALRFNQNNKEFFIFNIYPEDLLRYAYVFRKQYNPKAYQRMLQKKRLQDIGEFVKGEGNIFPNSIICVFKNGVAYDEQTRRLTIPRRYASIWIVDGQHRLYGFCYASKKVNMELFQLVCVGFNIKGFKKTYLRADEEARLFSDINAKAKKIPKDLLLEIKDLFGEYDRRVAIVKLFIKTKTFKNKIQTTMTKGTIHFATFVTTPPMWMLVKDDGIIIKNNISTRIAKDRKKEKYEAICFKVISKYFEVISSLYKAYWNQPQKYILATDRGIRGFLRLLIHILRYSKKWNKKEASKLLKYLDDFDFKKESLKGKYLGEAGAEDLAKEWTRIIQGYVPEFGPQSKKVCEELIKTGEVKKAESFIKRYFNGFEGEVVGQLMYINPSTLKYLKWIPQSCGIKIIIRGADPNNERIHDEVKKKMKNWRYVRIKQIKAYNKLNQERTFFHGRWISDNKYLIKLEVDLKPRALNPQHAKTVYDNPQLSKLYQEFEKIWDSSVTELERNYNLHKVEINAIA